MIFNLKREKNISICVYVITSSMYKSLDTLEVFGLLVFVQLRITCIQEEPIHVFCRPYPNTCHSSVKPVLVTVLWDMYRYVHSLKYGA